MIDRARSREILGSAQAAHDARDLTLAAELYERYLQATGDQDVLLALGDVSADVGRFERARFAYERLMEAEPDAPSPAARLGKLELRLGRAGAARAALRAAYLRGHRPGVAELEGRTPGVQTTTLLDALGGAGWLTTAGQRPVHEEPPQDGVGPEVVGAAPPAFPIEVVVGVLTRDAIRPDVLEAQAASHPQALFVLLTQVGDTDVRPRRHRTTGRVLHLRADGAEADRRLSDVVLRLAIASRADAVLASTLETAIELAERPDDWKADHLAGLVRAGQPGAQGPAVRVRWRMLAEVGGLDAVLHTAEGALIDLAARANRAGFTDASEVPWTMPRTGPDAAILAQRYPERSRPSLMARARQGARTLAGALTHSPPRLLIDASYLKTNHDGISEVSCNLIAALEAEGGFEVHLLCGSAAARFHGLQRFLLEGRWVESAEPGAFAACVRLAQPFDMTDLHRTWSAAPVAGFLMHDPIGLDCEYLNTSGVEAVWRRAFEASEVIGFVSQFSADQFARRFGLRRRSDRFVALNSTCAEEYHAARASAPRGAGVLIVGNAFTHKNVDNTVRMLRSAWPDLPVTVLGEGRPSETGLTWLRSGDLTPDEVDGLYEAAGVLVYPSHYEGFGLPVMHGLAHRRPVLALDQPAFREIKAASRLGDDLHLFDTTDALVRSVKAVSTAPLRPPRDDVQEQRWSDGARVIAAAVRQATSDFSLTALSDRLIDLLAAGAGAPRVEAANEPDPEHVSGRENLPSAARASDRLEPGRSLRRGGQIRSKTGAHALHLQSDGNLVLYAAPHGVPHLALWALGELPEAEVLALGADGRLELRDRLGEVLWSVQGPAGAWLEVRAGSMVLTDDSGPCWEAPDASQRPPPQPAFQHAPGRLCGGEELVQGARLSSRDGALTLILSSEGLMVETAARDRRSIWQVGTDQRPARLTMQADGNLVAYASEGRALWSTGTSGHDGAWAQLDEDGGLVVRRADELLWRAT